MQPQLRIAAQHRYHNGRGTHRNLLLCVLGLLNFLEAEKFLALQLVQLSLRKVNCCTVVESSSLPQQTDVIKKDHETTSPAS